MTTPFAAPRRETLIAFIIVCAFGILILPQFLGHWASDLAAVYIAGHMIATGQDALVYAADLGFFGGTPASWATLVAQMNDQGLPAFPYIYPPLWAELLSPLTQRLTPQQFFDLFGLVHTAAFCGSAWLAAKIARPSHMRFDLFICIVCMLAYFTTPLQAAGLITQPTMITTFLTLLAVERLQAGRAASAGVALALAAAIKLTPAAFALVFLIDRNWRALAAFAVAGSLLALICFVASPALSLQFLQQLPDVSQYSMVAKVNVSLIPALTSLSSILGLTPTLDMSRNAVLLGPGLYELPRWITFAPKLMLLVSLILTWRIMAPAPPALRRAGATLLIALILPLFGPLGWLHYYVLPLLMLPMLSAALTPQRAIVALGMFGFANTLTAMEMVSSLDKTLALYNMFSVSVWLVVLGLAVWCLRRLAGQSAA
jgi:hypothetical protein